jgi:hypothetical protein
MELKTVTDLLLLVVIIGLWSYLFIALFRSASKPLDSDNFDENWPFPKDHKP